MKVFTYFVEPASYTVDLIANVHSKQEVGYAFINTKSEAKTKEFLASLTFLSDFSLTQKIKFISYVCLSRLVSGPLRCSMRSFKWRFIV